MSQKGHAEMTCRELVAVLTDYFEDEMPIRDRRRLEAHLLECEGCATYVEQMRVTIDVLGELTEASIAPEAREALLTAFRAWAAG